uniref:Protein kinase domain-containing protein n=1 Tax=Oryza brachyantha TaxID=4533 RepID=J3KZS4_ORYBR
MPYYVTLEVMTSGEYDEKADVWSIDMVLYVMLFGGETAAKGRRRGSELWERGPHVNEVKIGAF